MRRLPLLLIAVSALAAGQSGPSVLDAETYLPAPKEIQSFLDAPRHLNATLGNQSPTGRYFLLTESAGMPRLADLGKPHYNLGGIQIDPKAFRARQLSLRGGVALIVIDATDWTRKRIEAPKGSLVSDAEWSPDGSQIAFLAHFDDATHLFLADPVSGKARRLTKTPILATQTRFSWTGDSKSIFTVLTNGNRPPIRSSIATQPRVQVADPTKNRLRTYRSLLENAEDGSILEYYLTGQLAKIGLDGKVEKIGKMTMIRSFDAAPKGDFVRVTTIQKPFSYIVPASNFGSKEEVWDLTGKSLVELSNRKLSAGDAGDATGQQPDSRRGLTWRPDGAGLSYIAPVDEPRAAPPASSGGESDEQGGRGGRGGQGAAPTAPRKEKLVLWSAPFGKDNIATVYQSDTGIGSVQYSADWKSIYVTETVSGTETLYKVDVTAPGERKNVYSYRPTPTAGGAGPGGGGGATQTPSNSPGTLVTVSGPLGQPVVRESGPNVFLRGTQQPTDSEKEGPRPFLDRVDVAAGKTVRVWQSPGDAYENFNAFLDAEGTRLLIDRQSPTDPNNTHLFENGAVGRMLTDNKDYAPDITAAKRYRIQVTRPDGFKFWVRVTVPKWHMPGMKLPAMFWFYPGEFTDQAAYDRGQRNFNKNLFPTVGNTSMALLTRLGYAFVDPDCPIVGPAGRMNDYYVNDLRNNLSATIDELERQGLIDRTKLAIGGHSYGGFSTANALVHTPFFKAGIAGAGNYNRTLTPISFQTETRSIYEAKGTYLDMSSMLHAENMTGALLMYCGMLDQNVGTDPINSIRMFNVLESIGKPAALYMYPYEDHGQIAKESLQDMWARWVAWLDKYVEPRGKQDKT